MPYNNAFAPAPAQVGEGVNYADIRAKQALAEALRKKAAAEYTPQSANYTVAGNNTVPDYVGVNWGGIVQNAMQPWVEQAQEKKAATAEGEAESARSAALEKILGNPNITPADAVRAQAELGVDLSAALPEKMNMAARAQASSSRAGLNAMLQMKVISPEEHQAAIAQLEADEKAAQEAELEQLRAKEAITGGSGGRAMTELEYFRNDPEGYAKFMAAKGGSGGGSLSGGAETATIKEIIDVGNRYKTLKTSRALESEMDKLVEGLPKTDKGGVGTKAATLATLSEMVPFVEQVQSPEADRLVAYINSQILAVAEGQKGVLSDTDMKIIKDSVANIKKNPESVRAVWDDTKSRLNSQQRAFESQLQNYGTAYGGQFAPTVGAYYSGQEQQPAAPEVPTTLAAPQKPTETPEQRKARLMKLAEGDE